MNSFDLLNLIYVVVFNVETALENAKLMIVKGLELQIFFASFQLWWKFSGILQKPKCHLCLRCKI